jgi:hypothetical protein
MFNITEITNAHRHRLTDKKASIPEGELFEFWPEDNKPMSYFSLVPEQFQRNTSYQKLSRSEKGDFLRLCLDIHRPGERGRFAKADGAMAKRMDMVLEEWVTFQGKLLDLKLLSESLDGLYLIQPELREQCLQYARKGGEKKSRDYIR